MRYFKVKNWEKYQHYKKRNPTWIKLHYEIMTSQDWVVLSDSSRVLAIVCMLIASRNDGMVPNDPAYIKRVAYLNSTPDFSPLIECEFLEYVVDTDKFASNVNEIASNFSSLVEFARPETEAEAETETEAEAEKEVCSEPEKEPVSEPVTEERLFDESFIPEKPKDDPVIMEFPLVQKGKTYLLRKYKLEEYQETYPAIDVLAEFRKYRQWLIDNPTKRKSNVPRFLTNCLNSDRTKAPRSPTINSSWNDKFSISDSVFSQVNESKADKQLWERIKPKLIEIIGKGDFSDWFDDATAWMDEKILILGIPSQYRREHIAKNYSQALLDACPEAQMVEVRLSGALAGEQVVSS